MTLTVDTLTTWMSKFAKKVETNKQFLSDLDTPIGDGDHGFNMDRGMKAVEEKLATKPADVTSGFKIIAMALISTVGGASGPLYGTAFLEMAKRVLLLMTLVSYLMQHWLVLRCVVELNLVTKLW